MGDCDRSPSLGIQTLPEEILHRIFTSLVNHTEELHDDNSTSLLGLVSKSTIQSESNPDAVKDLAALCATCKRYLRICKPLLLYSLVHASFHAKNHASIHFLYGALRKFKFQPLVDYMDRNIADMQRVEPYQSIPCERQPELMVMLGSQC